jgi:hypothetical protein
LKEVYCPVLKFREKKWIFAKVERGNVDFFLSIFHPSCTPLAQNKAPHQASLASKQHLGEIETQLSVDQAHLALAGSFQEKARRLLGGQETTTFR